jgi:MFS family permease
MLESPSLAKTNEVNKTFLLTFVFVLGIGSIQYGYSIGVYNAMQKDFERIFNWRGDEVDLWNGLITSICALGSAIGSIFAGAPAAKIGKLKCIHGANVLVGLGCALTLIENEYWILAGRFIFGLATGAFSVFVPSFINELSPNELKGYLGSLTQILITLGIFVANILGLPLPEKADNIPSNFINDQYWRVIFSLPILFALIQSALLMTVFNFETPKYLKMQRRTDELDKVMTRIYPQD